MISALEKLKTLLREEWYPAGMGAPDDEYDRYALDIWALLKRGAPTAEIERYLSWIEINRMKTGLTGRAGLMAKRAASLVKVG